ncbi:MAG: thiol:disulfide interchange protein DsbA/DsbL [Gammaproteobacteria bacterium]|nr:thiol:disulfide interchange protein DsbA/DsbL [Gammaproteobacteria bacterium]
MKNLIVLLMLALVATSCSKQEEVAAPAEVAAVVEEQVEEAAEAADDAVTETLQIVEESAAEVAPTEAAIVLARADEPAPRTWNYKEGKHYQRLVPTQPTVGAADKIEVAEVFMYSCPHCRDLESYLNRWEKDKDPGVRFVRIPASFNNIAELHAQLYYTEEVLARNGTLKDQLAFRALVFAEFHDRGNRLTTLTSIQRVFARAGVSQEDFERTWGSFEVNQKMRVAADLMRRYNIDGVPAIIVNGKYKTGGAQAGSYPKLIEVIDELTAREGLR